MTDSIRQFKYSFLPALLLIFGTACSTVQSHKDQFRSVYSEYASGNFEAAASKTDSRDFKKKLKSNDRLLWALEAGKLHHASGNFNESNRYFNEAEEIIADFENRAVLSLRAGVARTGAFLTNPAAIPYRGTASDRILLHSYKALNFLALGDLEGARVEIRRAYERQQEAIERNRDAIEKAKSENPKYNSVVKDPALNEAAPVDPALAKAYADFSNPFTTLLSGLIALADNDPARAEVDFRLLASLPLPNHSVKEEWNRIQQYFSGSNRSPLNNPRVFVILENGLGPDREEMRVDLLLPDIGYTGFAFPRIEFQPTTVGGIKISSSNSEIRTEQVASIDQVVATEFQARLPAMVLETIASVVTKEVVAKQMTDEWDGIGLLIGSLFKLAVNRADTRIWKTADKEIQFAAFDYPTDGTARLTLLGPAGNETGATHEINLPKGDFILVLIRTVNQHDFRITTQAIR